MSKSDNNSSGGREVAMFEMLLTTPSMESGGMTPA